MHLIMLIAVLAFSLVILWRVEMRYRQATYGPVSEVAMIVGVVLLLASLGGLGRAVGL